MRSSDPSRPITVPELPSHHVSELLARWRDGDEAALQQLIPIVHEELRRVPAGRWLGNGLGTRSRRQRSSTKHTCG